MWTKDQIVDMLRNNDLAVERAVVCLYDRQTNDEKRDSDTKHENQRGFRSNHASTGSFFARIILKGWKQQPDGKKRVHLNPEKLAKARKIVLQYHRQLTEQANLNADTRVPRSQGPKTYDRMSAEEKRRIDEDEDRREKRKSGFAGADDPVPPRSSHQPQPGTWAATARAMVQMGIMSGDEADDWKDRMKDG